jgi:hypothetical protein
MNTMSYKKSRTIEVQMDYGLLCHCHDITENGKLGGHIYIKYNEKIVKFFPEDPIVWINEKCQVMNSGFRGKIIEEDVYDF